MKVSRGTVLRAYDFANRDEAAAAAREGRKPSRPAYKWGEESRAAKRKPRGGPKSARTSALRVPAATSGAYR